MEVHFVDTVVVVIANIMNLLILRPYDTRCTDKAPRNL